MRLIATTSYRLAVESKSLKRNVKKCTQRKRQKLFTPQDKLIQYSPWQAFQLMRLHSFTTFTQTVDVIIHLGVNPKHGDHIVRGSAFMPCGIGKQTKVAVLCPNSIKQQINNSVDLFVDQKVLKGFQKGIINFQTLFTTPQLIGQLKPYGKMLGPRGLMPNVKVGTLVSKQQLKTAIQRAKFGQVNFKVDSQRNLHAKIGKISFTDQQLLTNFHSLVNQLVKKKPATSKGKYFKQVFIKTTMGPSWRLSPQQIDPRNSKNIWNLIN